MHYVHYDVQYTKTQTDPVSNSFIVLANRFQLYDPIIQYIYINVLYYFLVFEDVYLCCILLNKENEHANNYSFLKTLPLPASS